MPGSERHFKTVNDGCKVFFLPLGFSLAFDEKKSILRNKNEPAGVFFRDSRGVLAELRKKNERESFLFLTKSSIFDK